MNEEHNNQQEPEISGPGEVQSDQQASGVSGPDEVQSNQEGEVKESGSSEQGQINAMALLSYLGILVLIPLLTDSKEDEFVKFHIKQGLALLIMMVAAMFIVIIPIIGWVLSPLIAIVSLVFVIIGLVNVLQGKKKKLPLIGDFGEKFKI